MKKRKRLQIDFSRTQFKELFEMKKILDVSSVAQVVRRALAFLSWMFQMRREGYSFRLKKEDEIKEVVLI